MSLLGDHCSIPENGLSPATEEDTLVDSRTDPPAWLRRQLEEADVDLLREMVRTFAANLMSAEADALFGVNIALK